MFSKRSKEVKQLYKMTGIKRLPKTRPRKGSCPGCGVPEKIICDKNCPIYDPHDPFAF